MNKKFFLAFLFGFKFIFSLNIKNKFKIFFNKGMSFFSNKSIKNEKMLNQIQKKQNLNMEKAFFIYKNNLINGRKIYYYRNNDNNILNNNFKEKLNKQLAENYKDNYIKKHKRLTDIQKAINEDLAKEIFTKYRVLLD